MFPKCFHFITLTVIFLLIQGTAGFFVKHVQTGKCINDTSIIQEQSSSWGKLYFVELSNNCLDPAAQFRFRDNGAMLNLKRQGCLSAHYKDRSGYYLDMFYIYVDAFSLDRSACAQKPGKGIYRAINQTTWGGLSVYYKGYHKASFQTWCASNGHHKRLAENQGIDPYVKLTTPCTDAPEKRFHFGSVTCYGNMIRNANCPKDQYMVVKTASYRGLSVTKTCGLSDDYSCEVDATCLVKKKCDGQHECNITVDDNLFPANSCQGFTRYLYFEYQCTDSSTPYTICVDDVSLSHSSLPNEGFVKLLTKYSGNQSVCWESLKNSTDDVVCRQLGYKRSASLVKQSAPSDVKDQIFPGSIYCNGEENYLSQCAIDASTKSCSELSYINCHICNRPLLKDEQKFPNSSFTASVSSEGHSASDGRISSGSSWCAPVSNDKHYLQVDLGRLYVIDTFVTFGDSSGLKWVTSYSLNYTVDLINWRPILNHNIAGNTKAVNHAAIQQLSEGKTIRALRFIPLSFVGQPCVRIEICGWPLLPDKPSNLTVTKRMSRNAQISWQDPQKTGDGNLTGFWIQLKKGNFLVQNITTSYKVNKYEANNLMPYTTYEISVAARNKNGFGEESIISFMTAEEVPSGPPLNVKTTSRTSSSLSFTWDPPEKDKQNGVIISYTACVSLSENGLCFQAFTTNEREWIVRKLNSSTKYYIRVLATNKVGNSAYSESKGIFTNGRAAKKATDVTSSTLTFSLEIPSKSFVYFYIVALKSKDGQEPTSSPDSYENNELVTYDEAIKSTNPKPYIAAVITSKNENMFILGDGRNTSNPTSRRRRSTSSDYYNGPLEPSTSYSIFQRTVINKEGDFYSTDWSPASITNEYKGGPLVLTNMSSGEIKAKEGGVVTLLCSAQGEPPITFSWEKDKKPLESFMEKENPHRSSLLVVTMKDEASFGKYTCLVRDRFQSTTHTIWIEKDTGKEENGAGCEKYLAGIIVVIILLIISLLVTAYFIYRNRRPKSSKESAENKIKGRNNFKEIYENPDKVKEDANYEQVEDEQSTYTALKKTGKEADDDHLYSHLNEVHNDYAHQRETGI